MKYRMISLLLAVFFLGVQQSIPASFAQSLPAETPSAQTPSAGSFGSASVDQIEALMEIIVLKHELQRQVSELAKELHKDISSERQAAISKKTEELYDRIEDLDQNFTRMATGIDWQQFSEETARTFDWQKELQDLFRPIIEELKQMTARPRELERLRGDITYNQKRLELAEKAVTNLEAILQSGQSAQLQDEFERLYKEWQGRQQEFKSQLAILQRELEERSKTNRSFVDSAQTLFREFFRDRGRNLLFAMLAFFSVLFIMQWIQKGVYKFFALNTGEKRPFSFRVAGLVFYVLTFLTAITASLLILYLSGDWMLFALLLIFLFGIAWAGKQTIPLVWEQAKLFLNLSTVREGERVIYQGLPWKILDVNMYTRLHNPELKGGLIRLPLRELIGLHSRPFYKHEPWFPCAENDWIQLDDGTFGKVILQTPEQVVLEAMGGARKTYPTSSFLQQNPLNLSIQGFGVSVSFGLDYTHQATITGDIPEQLQQFLLTACQQESFGAHLSSLSVQFQEAADSALVLQILAIFAGAAAPDMKLISRALQRLSVDACNQYGWTIPFPQLTVHRAGQ